jgi:signal transducer and activator of transcription 5B
LNQFVIELERKANEMDVNRNPNLHTPKFRLNESARNFRQLLHNPGWLYTHLRNCLQFEQQLTCGPDTDMAEILRNIQECQVIVRRNDSDNKSLRKEYENFCLQLHEITKTTAQLATAAHPQHLIDQVKIEQQDRVNVAHNHLIGKRLELVDSFRKVIESIREIMDKVLDKHLFQWKVNQGSVGNGAPPININSLDVIQGWCEGLAVIIWDTREQIKLASHYKNQVAVDEPNLPDYLPALREEVTNLLMNLITSTFVIVKQPPQVIKTGTKFESTVRLLVGNTLNIKMNSPLVKVAILSGKW